MTSPPLSHPDDPNQMYNCYFRHLYLTSGFDVLKENPRQLHACLLYGYWCWSNAWEHPYQIKIYFKLKLRRLRKKLALLLDKLVRL